MLTGYYQKKKNKERISKKTRKRYQSFSEEEIDKKRHYFCDRYKIFLKKKKKRSINKVVNDIKIF